MLNFKPNKFAREIMTSCDCARNDDTHNIVVATENPPVCISLQIQDIYTLAKIKIEIWRHKYLEFAKKST